MSGITLVRAGSQGPSLQRQRGELPNQQADWPHRTANTIQITRLEEVQNEPETTVLTTGGRCNPLVRLTINNASIPVASYKLNA